MYDDISLPAQAEAQAPQAPVPETVAAAGNGGPRPKPRDMRMAKLRGHSLAGRPKKAFGERKKLFLEVMGELEKHGDISMRKLIIALYDKAVGNTRKGDVEAAKELLNRRFGRVRQVMEVKDSRVKDPKERDRLILAYINLAGADTAADQKLLESSEVTDGDIEDDPS